MNNSYLTFQDCAELLRQNGLVAAPLSVDTGTPIGPYAVMQIPYERNDANRPLPVGVLTHVPVALSAEAPVQDAAATWLATISVRVRAALAPEVDAILQRYTGKNCPARVEDDGGRRYVLRLSGERFSTVSTGYNELGDYVRVDGGPGFVPLSGEWTPAGGLLVVQRSELPEIDSERATALVTEVEALLDKHAKSVIVPERRRRPPLPDLAKGERLEFLQAREPMTANGFDVCAFDWGSERVSDQWYLDYRNSVVWNPGANAMGAGLFLDLRGRVDRLAYVSIEGRDAEQIARADAALVAGVGAGLLRMSSDGSRLRLYQAVLVQKAHHFINPPAGRAVQLRVVCSGALVVSGLDAGGEVYRWPEGSPVTTKRETLPHLDGSQIDWILKDVEAALQTPAQVAPDATPAMPRGRRARA